MKYVLFSYEIERDITEFVISCSLKCTLLFFLTGAHGQRTLQAPETMQWAIRQTEPPTGARPTVTSATANATSTGTSLCLYMAPV